MDKEEANFIKLVPEGLPYTDKTDDNRFCYSDLLPKDLCSDDADLLGTLDEAYTIIFPGLSRDKCINLLTAQWPYVAEMFGSLFPDFDYSQGRYSAPMLMVRTGLYSLILRFGYLEMSTWTAFIAAINAPASNWRNYIAWLSPSPGFTVDGVDKVSSFPSSLQEWLLTYCPLCGFEIEAIFNSRSTFCEDSSCSSDVSELCGQTLRLLESPCYQSSLS